MTISRGKFILLPLMIYLISAGIAAGETPDAGERRVLSEEQRELSGRIEKLRQEQDYLLFLKTMHSLDSKYLVFTASDKSGKLKYKNRILKEFKFSSVPKRIRLAPGMVVLTRKEELSGGKKQLAFGTSFIVLRKHTADRSQKPVPRLWLSKKDFKSVFAALEEGSPAYILP